MYPSTSPPLSCGGFPPFIHRCQLPAHGLIHHQQPTPTRQRVAPSIPGGSVMGGIWPAPETICFWPPFGRPFFHIYRFGLSKSTFGLLGFEAQMGLSSKKPGTLRQIWRWHPHPQTRLVVSRRFSYVRSRVPFIVQTMCTKHVETAAPRLHRSPDSTPAQ